MGYLATTTGNYRKLTDISSGFNGVTTTFQLSVPPGTSAYYVTPRSTYQLIISVNGVIKNPGVDYTLNLSQIVFTSAPTSGQTFFGVLMGDAINIGAPSDGTVNTAKLTTDLTVTHALGSAGSPSITFSGNTNNGIFSPATDNLAVTTAGVERLRVNSFGRVGIGTASPGTALEVNGFIQTQSGAFSGGGYNIKYNVSAAASRSWQLITDNTAYGDFTIQQSTTQTGSTYTPRLYIDSSGNVGIGTVSPAAKIEAVTSSNGDGLYLLYASTPLGTTGPAISFRNYNNSNTPINIASIKGVMTGGAVGVEAGALVFNTATGGAAPAERLRIDSSGRLLVGTSTARSNFRFSGINYTGTVQHELATQPFSTITSGSASAAGPYLILAKQRSGTVGGNTLVANDDDLGVIAFQGSDGTNMILGAVIEGKVDGTPGANDMPGRLVFSTTADGASSPTERLRIDSSGKVGIGTASPTEKLEVAGGIRSTGSLITGVANSTALDFAGGTSRLVAYGADASTQGTFAYLSSNSTATVSLERLRIDSSGRVGIGTNSPGYKLTVQSDSADTTFSTPYLNYGIIIRNDDQTNNNYSGFSFNTKNSAGADNTVAAIAAQCTNHTSGATNGTLAFFTTGSGALTERLRIDSSGLLKFDSGYGSAAAAYGCRAWVNYSGTGTTVSASGNVSSVTKNGTGDYTMNFSTAMSDANYSASVIARRPDNLLTGSWFVQLQNTATQSTSAFQVATIYNPAGSPTNSIATDSPGVFISIFR